MLNIEAIRGALESQPLCDLFLVSAAWVSEARRCAIGALLHHIGVSDEELRVLDTAFHAPVGDSIHCAELLCDMIWERYGTRLTEAYGVESAEQLITLMVANDEADDKTRAHKVIETAERL